MAIEIDSDEARLLVEIGFLGLGRGMPEAAEVVFSAISRLRPGQEAGPVGLALVALAQGAPERAVAILRAAPQTEAVLAFRAMAHARLGDRSMARELRDELRDMGADGALVTIAEDAAQG